MSFASQLDPLVDPTNTPFEDIDPRSFLSPTPQPLRKSLSVDSFVRLASDEHDSSHNTNSVWPRVADSFRASSESVVDPAINVGKWRTDSLPPATTQSILPSRGDAIYKLFRYPMANPSSQDGHEDAAYPESDLEGDPMHFPSSPKVDGPKVSAQARNQKRRQPSSSTASSSSNLSSAHAGHISNKRRDTPMNRSRRSTGPTMSAHGRARRNSLGDPLASDSRPVVIDTRTAIASTGEVTEVVVAIVGDKGCGKSSIIRYGLKGFDVSTVKEFQTEGLSRPSISYALRTAQGDYSNIPTVINVVEVDAEHLRSASGLGHDVWPDNLPRIDGVLACYDASRTETFEDIANLMKGYHERQIPAIVIAGKSDLQKTVEPSAALSVIQLYAGIVEVSTMNDHGRRKMRKCFHWVVDAIRRKREKASAGIEYENPASPSVLTSTGPWSRGPSLEKKKSRSSSSASLHLLSAEGSSLSTFVEGPSVAADVTTVAVVGDMPSPPTGDVTTEMRLQSHPLVSMTSNSKPATPTPTGSPRMPSSPTSPTRARSTGDLLLEAQRRRTRERELDRDRSLEHFPADIGRASSRGIPGSSGSLDEPLRDISDGALDDDDRQRLSKEKEPVHAPWATMDELLDKLFFLSVSSDHPVFLSRFLLTYRRFTSPRNILLGMQKRMIELGQPSQDASLACFAQMKLCALLDTWMKEYPNDFAVPGTAGALSALVKQIISNTHLLHYGSDFLPFLEQLPTLRDSEATWAMKVDDALEGSDDSDDGTLEEDDNNTGLDLAQLVPPPHNDEEAQPSLSNPYTAHEESIPGNSTDVPAMRERTTSQPLAPKELMRTSTLPHPTSSVGHDAAGVGAVRTPSRDLLKELTRVATSVSLILPLDIANEITRIDSQHFLEIEPRHWLQHVLSNEKKDPDVDTIPRFNAFFNRLSNWFTSLILCHDRPRMRARQMEKFAAVGEKLRILNNYSGLRAVVNGISNSTFEGDPALELFSQKDIYRQYQSWDRLFQSLGSHRAYRMALSNSKGARIPCLEVHMVDLYRAHQANPDVHPDNPSKINWGKYNMMGKFISVTTECQAHCRLTDEYTALASNRSIYNLLMCPIMDEDMWPSRMAAPEDYIDDLRPTASTSAASHEQPTQTKDTALLRKIFFWDK